MIFVGIDVAKDKHDCFICNSEGEVIKEAFTIGNNLEGFEYLSFAQYLDKKRAEGKHYNVAVSHAAKKLVRLIFALQKSGHSYIPNA